MMSSITTPTATSAKPVRVMVIEGQALFAKALCQVLASDTEIEVVGDSDSVANAPLRRARPDLIVLDLDGHTIELVRGDADSAASRPPRPRSASSRRTSSPRSCSAA